MLIGAQVFVVEFKMAASEDKADAALADALAQIRARGYDTRYRTPGRTMHHIAVICGREARNLLRMGAEPAD